MEQYIPKSALVAEIERRLKHNTEWKDACKTFAVLAANQAIEEDKKILSIINTLEVKEVDYKPIDNDFERDAVQFCFDNALNTTPRIAKTIAKHFFELGMQVSNKQN